MTHGQVYFGLFSMLLFFPIMLYSMRILEHFLASDDLSMVRVFEQGQGLLAFRVLAATFLIYAATLIISGYGDIANITVTMNLGTATNPHLFGVVANLDRIGGLTAFLGLAFFLYRIADLTRL